MHTNCEEETFTSLEKELIKDEELRKVKPLTLKEKLLTLVANRIDTQRKIYKVQIDLNEKETKLTIRQHELKLVLDEMAASDEPEARKRFSSADKRKFEFQKLVNVDPKIKEYAEEIQKLKLDLFQLECVDRIEKIDEKYLFKLIDLELEVTQ